MKPVLCCVHGSHPTNSKLKHKKQLYQISLILSTHSVRWRNNVKLNTQHAGWKRRSRYAASWVEQGLTSHQTHYRSYRGRVFTGQMTQPTMLQDACTAVLPSSWYFKITTRGSFWSVPLQKFQLWRSCAWQKRIIAVSEDWRWGPDYYHNDAAKPTWHDR